MEIAEKICLPSHHSPHHPSMLSSLPASQPPCPHRPVILTDQVWIIDALSSLPTSLRSLFPSLFSAALHGLTLREAALLSHINLPSQVCGAQQWGRGEGSGDEGVAFGVDCRHTAQVFSLFFLCTLWATCCSEWRWLWANFSREKTGRSPFGEKEFWGK